MIAIITQARVNSNRLPNKIFKQAAAKPFLHFHLTRLASVGIPIIVATTNDGSEKPIVSYCEQNDLPVFCGSELNVLDRFYQCAVKYGLSHMIRVTSDCPLIDADIIKQGLKIYEQEAGNVYYSNALQRTYPRGMDYEIFSFPALETAWKMATIEADKEHVTPYIWNNRAGNVNILHDAAPVNNADLRITLDTVEDETLLRTLIEDYNAHTLNCAGIVNLLRNNPALVAINKAIEQKKL